MPEKELSVSVAPTGLVYQLLKSGGRAGMTEALGVEISILSMYWRSVDPSGNETVQLTVVLVSAV